VEENDSWELIDLPCGHRPIGLMWVFKLKPNKADDIIKHKSPLITKGYIQQTGIDYDDAFAPIVQFESVHMLLALTGHNGWAMHLMDVKSMFLNQVL
jgi:hypothetical protein